MKKSLNYIELKNYFKEKFIEVIPVLVKNKDTVYLIKYFTDFYKDLLLELSENIIFVPDEKYDLSYYNKVIKKLEDERNFCTAKLVNFDITYPELFAMLLYHHIYPFLFSTVKIDPILSYEYYLGKKC